MKTTRFLAISGAFALIAATAPIARAADDAPTATAVTFHKDVLPILQNNCQTCHRAAAPGLGVMIAPMALENYQEVRPWAKSIMQQVASRAMPPWFASDHTKGQFANERTLTDAEIQTIERWVQTGAPAGNPADAPPPRTWPDAGDGWTIGKPDLIVNLAEPFLVKDDVVDLNIVLKGETITHEMLPEPRYISAVEFKAGSPVVHHIIGSRRAEEAEEPGAQGMLGGMAPGTDPFYLPATVGRLLTPGTQIFFQMHYHKEAGPGTGVLDHSQIGFKFHPKDAKIEHRAEWSAIGNRDFEIPPHHPNWEVGASRTFEHDTTIYAYLPHMHLRGKAAKYVAFYPDGTQELLLDVPKYDFKWQTNYTYKEPKRIPAGTRIDVTMVFDNSAERAAIAPEVDPTREIRFGGPTTDEMMLGWIDFAEHLPPNAPPASHEGGA